MLAQATDRMKHLHRPGIRTIISFQTIVPDADEKKPSLASPTCVELEREAATAAGINFVSRPLNNTGKNSFEDMTDAQVVTLLDSVVGEIFKDSADGGVLFHCSCWP